MQWLSLDDGVRHLGHSFDLHVAVLGLPLVVLLHEDGADEADDQVLIGEDADDVSPSFDLLVETLQRIRTVQFGAGCAGKAM